MKRDSQRLFLLNFKKKSERWLLEQLLTYDFLIKDLSKFSVELVVFVELWVLEEDVHQESLVEVSFAVNFNEMVITAHEECDLLDLVKELLARSLCFDHVHSIEHIVSAK